MGRKTLSFAALKGTRDPPRMPVKTEPKAVTMIRPVMTFAVVLPQECSITSDAMVLDLSESCHGKTPRIPMFITR